MVFVCDPVGLPAGAVTWNVTVQVPGLVTLPAGMVPPARLTVRGGVIDTAPPQVVVAVPGTTVNTVPGRVSDTFTPVYGVPFGFCSVMVRVLVPPAGKDGGEKDLESPISWTFKRAESGTVFVRPCWVCRALAGIVLRYDPCIFEVTLTWMVQVEFGAIVALFSVTVLPPLTAVTEAEPPQPARAAETGLARETLAGRLSVIEAWVSVVPGSLFVIAIVNWLVCPAQIVLGLKLLVTVGD